MESLKKSFFGGYKKEAVDNTLEALNKKISDLEASNKRLQFKTEADAVKMAKLEDTLAEYSAENKRLKDEAHESSPVFKSIAKVYERAYGVGADIVKNSKSVANDMLNEVDESVVNVLNSTKGIVNDCEELHCDFKEILKNLGDSLNKVAQNADIMLEKARLFNSIHTDLDSVAEKAKSESEKIFGNYEASAAEFISFNSKAPEAEGKKPSSDYQEAEEAVTELTQKESVEVVEESIQADTIVDNEEIAIIPSQTVVVEESESEEFEISPIVSLPVQSAEFVEEAEKEPTTPESTAQTSVKAVGNGDFTQFGRKSKLSTQDRSELLRKALLKQ